MLHSLGQKFVEFFSNYGFEKIMRVAGRRYRDFLVAIDQLHDSNRFSFPKMKSPLFFVNDEDPYGLFLHYQLKNLKMSSLKILKTQTTIFINFLKISSPRLQFLCGWTVEGNSERILRNSG